MLKGKFYSGYRVGSALLSLFFVMLWGQCALAQNLPKVISVGEDGKVKHWDSSGKAITTIGSQFDAINAVALVPGGLGQVATGDSEGTLKVWDISDARAIFTLDNAHKGSILAIAASPNGRYIATGGSDHHIRIWNSLTGKRLGDVEAHQDSVRTLQFTHNSEHLLSGSSDNQVRMWHIEAGAIKYESNIPAHDDAVTALALSPDGGIFASASRDKWVKTWKADGSGQQNRMHADHPLLSIAFSPDGQKIAVGDEDGHIRIFDTAKGTALPFHSTQDRAVRTIAFSKDGKILVSGGDDGKIHYWDVADGKELQKISAHDRPVTALIVVP